MKKHHVFLCSLTLIAGAIQADASTLYGSTAAGGSGELWIIDPITGAGVQDIGPLNDTNGANYPLTGLAFNPVTGVLYGTSANSNPLTKGKLVTVDPATATVTLVGALNVGTGNTMAGLSFDASGNLYGVGSVGGAQLYSVNTTTGQATSLGSAGFAQTGGGGLAISPGHVFYAVPVGNNFGTFDPGTGAYTFIGTLATPSGGGTSYAALAFDGNTLYGLDLGSPTHLVTIDLATAVITDIGPSVASIDGISFQPAPPAPSLTVQLSTTNVVLSWPTSAAGYRLIQNTNLNTTNWVANAGPTNVAGSTNQVTVPATDAQVFFRLVKP